VTAVTVATLAGVSNHDISMQEFPFACVARIPLEGACEALAEKIAVDFEPATGAKKKAKGDTKLRKKEGRGERQEAEPV
jgi:hypothetical protein